MVISKVLYEERLCTVKKDEHLIEKMLHNVYEEIKKKQ